VLLAFKKRVHYKSICGKHTTDGALFASEVDKYHLQLHQDDLVRLATTWDKYLPDFGVRLYVGATGRG
jgi:hypothetical protein